MEAINLIGTKYHQVRSWMSFVQFVKNPLSTEKIFDMAESFQKSSTEEMIEKIIRPAFSEPRFEQAYQEKYFPVAPSLEELSQMPTESLGYHFYAFMKKWDLDPYLFPKADFSGRNHYFRTRYYQSHDLWHVLTGYSTDLVDEMALQAFGVGQHNQPLGLLIISGGLIHLLQQDPARAGDYMKAITEGFERGQKAKNLLVEPIFERLHEPIEVVRRDLNISERPQAL